MHHHPTLRFQIQNAVITLMMFGIASHAMGESSSLSHPKALLSGSPVMTLQDAEEYALKHNPAIAAASRSAEAARQVVTEIRAGFFPQVGANAIYAYTPNGQTHIDATGLLADSKGFTRQSDGLVASQLITDFGRTAFLTSSSSFEAMAQFNQVDAVKQFILLSVDTAYYTALGAIALQKVADQEIKTNELLLEQIKAFVTSNLKPQIDVSFQESTLAQSRLLKVDADGKYDEAIANLIKAMGWKEISSFSIVEKNNNSPFPEDSAPFQAKAFGLRPDLIAKRNEVEAAMKTAKAEFSARLPQVTALAAAGFNPYVQQQNSPLSDSYGMVGVNVSVPIFTGGRLSAKQKEAELRASAMSESLKDYEEIVFKDVRNAWVRARTSYHSIAAAQDYEKAATEAFDLAQGRYTAGISSITEVSQAEVIRLQAQIALVTAHYDYLSRLAALAFESGDLTTRINPGTPPKK